MVTIATNTAANSAARFLNMNASDSASSVSKLASGSRIVRASDDASGLAISTRLSSDSNVLKQAATNASQASSILQIADGGLSNISDTLQRMKSLAAQSLSGVPTDTERAYIDVEFQELKSEIDGIANTTRFNGDSLLNGFGDGNNQFGASLDFFVGTDSSDVIQVDLTSLAGDGNSTQTLEEFRANVVSLVETSLTSMDQNNPNLIAGGSSVSDVVNAIFDADGNGTYDDGALSATAVTAEIALDGNGNVDVASTDLDRLANAISQQLLTGSEAGGDAAGELSDGANGINAVVSDTGGSVAITDLMSQLSAGILAEVTEANSGGTNNVADGNLADVANAIEAALQTVITDTYDAQGTGSIDPAAIDLNVVADLLDAALTGGVGAETSGNVGGPFEQGATGEANSTWFNGTGGADDNTEYLANMNALMAAVKTDLTGATNIDIAGAAASLIQDDNAQTIAATISSALGGSAGGALEEATKNGNVTNFDSRGLGLATSTVATATDATNALNAIDTAIESISEARANVGALISRFDTRGEQIATSIENLDAANSVIKDVDLASEQIKLVAANSKTQAAVSALSQANQQPQQLLRILN